MIGTRFRVQILKDTMKLINENTVCMKKYCGLEGHNNTQHF